MGTKHDLKSFKLNIANGQSTGNIDWTLTEPVDLVALHIFPINAVLGDTISINILYGSTVIGAYAVDTHITQDILQMNFDRQDPLQIPAGLTVRLIYTAIDSSGRDFILWTRFRQ